MFIDVEGEISELTVVKILKEEPLRAIFEIADFLHKETKNSKYMIFKKLALGYDFSFFNIEENYKSWKTHMSRKWTHSLRNEFNPENHLFYLFVQFWKIFEKQIEFFSQQTEEIEEFNKQYSELSEYKDIVFSKIDWFGEKNKENIDWETNPEEIRMIAKSFSRNNLLDLDIHLATSVANLKNVFTIISTQYGDLATQSILKKLDLSENDKIVEKDYRIEYGFLDTDTDRIRARLDQKILKEIKEWKE